MKEIWINSELYIKSYEFSIFRDFFRIFKLFFLILFSIFKPFLINNKNNNNKKKGRGARMDATWHTRPRGSATRTHAARLRGAYILYIIYLLNIKRSSAFA